MKKIHCMLSVVSCLVSMGVIAAPTIPASSLPEQVGKMLKKEEKLSAPRTLNPISSAPEKNTSPLGVEAEKIKLKLNGIILEGNHVYSKQQLENLYKAKLHQEISVSQLFEIVTSITNFYRNNGYILSRAILPPQHVKNGIVHVRIIEGYIGEIKVQAPRNSAACLVQAIGNQIKKDRPLELSYMEKYLLLANEIPATQVKAVLAPAKKEVGAASLNLLTETKPINGYISYDNYGTRYIGPQQFTANFGLNSFLNAGDSGQMTLTKTPRGSELTFADASYSMALNDRGTRLLIGATRTATMPQFVLQPVEIEGVNKNYYASLLFPVIRNRSEMLSFRASFSYLDSHVTTLGSELYTDHIRSIGIGASYNFADRYRGSNSMNVDLRQGLPILAYTSDHSTTAQTSRPGGRGNYTKISMQLGRVQALKAPFSLYGALQGQYALSALLASEQFSFGGSQMGRGYDVAEIIGDKGVAASLEARYDWNVAKLGLQLLQLYAFYDAGMVWNYKLVSGTPKKLTAMATGFGTRFYFTKHVSGNLMWAQPITRQVAAEKLIGNGTRPRVFFSIVASLD